MSVTRRRLYSVDVGDFTGLVITGSNGAWGKSENIKDISYTDIGNDEVEVTYKTKGFNPALFELYGAHPELCTVNCEVPM